MSRYGLIYESYDRGSENRHRSDAQQDRTALSYLAGPSRVDENAEPHSNGYAMNVAGVVLKAERPANNANRLLSDSRGADGSDGHTWLK